jgi:hypothetical protein
VILLLAGGFVVLIGWVAGCVLLWASPRWRWPDKLLGTLVWPGGLAGVAAVFGFASSSGGCVQPACQAGNGGLPTAAVVALAAVALLAPLVVAFWLLHRARRLPEQTTPEDTLSPVRY